MTLTEVVYKIRNEDFPLCTFTESNTGVTVVLTTTSWNDEERHVKAVVTALGPEDKLEELEGTLAKLFDESEKVQHEKDQAIFRVGAALDTLLDNGNPYAFALQYFGEGAILEPVLVQGGYFNVRLIVLGKVDLASMLASYEAGVKADRWNDFKLVRIDTFDPQQQVTGAFTEGLTQKQLEVIKTALALGFYETPRKITLDDLSNIFGISKAAVHNRLQAAERKVISKFFS